MKRVIAILSILFAGACMAQAGLESGRLTLDSCIERALEANYSIMMKREELNRAQSSYLSNLSSFMPSSSARFSWGRNEQESFSYSESGLIVSRDHYNAGISASQTIFEGGKNLLSTKSARLSRDITSQSLTENEANLVYSVKNAFFTVISAEHTAKNASAALERIEDQFTLVSERDKLGLADPTELTQIKVSKAQNQLTLLQAQNTLQKAVESLAGLLAMPLDTPIGLVDPGIVVAAPGPMEEYIKLALENHPQVMQAEMSLQKARLSKLSSWANYLPGINASYSYSWSNSEMPESFVQFDDEAKWSVGLSANWNLFSGVSRIASIQSANSMLRDAENSLLLVKQSIEASVRDAYRNLQEADARIQLSDARLEDARLNEELFVEKYGLGDCTLLELLQAELSLQQAETEAISAQFDYNMAISELLRLSGKID